MAQQPNYTEEEFDQLKVLYAKHKTEGLEQIAEIMNRPVRSIRAKLVKEGLYVGIDPTTKHKKNGPSKKELLRDFETLGIDPTGLEGATKTALERVLKSLSNVQQN